jgi:hypothetical protein
LAEKPPFAAIIFPNLLRPLFHIGPNLHASQTAPILTQVFDETLHLLPAAASHWPAIAEYVVTKKAAGDYDYPEFLAKLKEAGVTVPDP